MQVTLTIDDVTLEHEIFTISELLTYAPTWIEYFREAKAIGNKCESAEKATRGHNHNLNVPCNLNNNLTNGE